MKLMSRSSAACAGIVVLVAAAVGCARGGAAPAVRLTPSADIPAAEGEVKAARHNGNTEVEIEVKRLAAPGRVVPGTSAYVVWVRPVGQEDAQPQNIGTLSVDQNLEGSLATVTPLRTFEIFITAEPSATASSPSNEPLMRGLVQRPA